MFSWRYLLLDLALFAGHEDDKRSCRDSPSKYTLLFSASKMTGGLGGGMQW